VDEDVGLAGTGSADGQLTVSTVHGVSGLEGDDLGPAKLVEVKAEFGWGVAEANVVVVHEAVDGVNLTADVVVVGLVEEELDGWVVWITAENLLGLLLLVWLVDIVDVQNSEVAVVAAVAECDASAGLDTKSVDVLLGQIQANGHREQVAICETVVLHDTVVVLLVHETLERGESSVEDEFEIAQLTVTEDNGWQSLGLSGELSSSRRIAGNKILEDSA
jgi:hypothetical protein